MYRQARTARYAAALAIALLACAPVSFGSTPASGSAVSRPLDYFLRSYELLTIDPAAAATEVRERGTLHVASARGPLTLVLAKRDLRAKNFREEVSAHGAKVALERGDVKTYAGTVAEIPNSRARFTVDDGEVSGMILLDDDALFVEPVRNYEPDASERDYVLYRATDVNPDAVSGTCAATEAGRVDEAAARIAASDVVTTFRVIQLATEADNEYVSSYGSGAAANSEILSIVNQIEGVYERDLNLTFDVVYQHAWETSTPDPYSGTDATAMLDQFRSHWNANFSSVQRDMAHMWTGRDMNGSTIGIAWVGVVCSNPAYAYGVSQRMTSSPQRYILSAHEMGHNLSACHSDTSCNGSPSSCSNTIMQSFVGTGFAFCAFSQGQINSYVAASGSCLSTQTTTATAATTIGSYVGATGTFFLRNSNSPGGADMVFGYGPANAVPVVGDWDANGTETIGDYVPATGAFYLRNSNSPGAANMTFAYGPANAIPVAGDWDGNGTDTVGVYVPATSTFFLRNSNTSGAADLVVSFGAAGSGWTPIVGDWNGDGRDTVGLYNPQNGGFFLRNTNTNGPADVVFTFGPGGARPIVGDWNDSGSDSIGVAIPGSATFFLRNTNSAGPADTTLTFGAPPLNAITGNWDGA